MNYKEIYSEQELESFEIVSDWTKFAKDNIQQDVMGRNKPVFIDKKIFDIDFDLSFNGEYSGEFVFINCYFKKGFFFKGAKFRGKFSLINSHVKGTIYTEGVTTFESGFSIIDSDVDGILLTKGKFGSCSWSLKKVGSMTFSGGAFTDLNIQLKDEVGQFKIDASNISGDIFIDGCENLIEAVNITGTARGMSLFIYNIEVSHFVIGLFINESRFKLSNIKSRYGKGNMLFTNSHLGKAELSSIGFKEFKSVILDEVNLVDVSFNNVLWSNNVYGSLPSDKHLSPKAANKTNSLKSRETFRQLKYAMSKQGDVINEQKFHSLEMGMYFEVLSWGKDFWTKLIILLSWLTSDFGQSFWRPLFFIFIFHTILFIPLLYSGVPFEFKLSLTKHSWEAFWNGVNNYFFLMNPFRKVDENVFKGGWIIIDIFMRISASYMIYNMVRATRRFIK